MARYKPQAPENYPYSWLTATLKALPSAPGKVVQIGWISVEYAKTQSAALDRMKRLRAFRDGLLTAPHRFPELSPALEAGYVFALRKVFDLRTGYWDIQVGWKPGQESLKAIASEVLQGKGKNNA